MCRGIPSGSEPLSGAPPRALFIPMAVGMIAISFAILFVAAFTLWCRRRRQSAGSDSDRSAHATISAAARRHHRPFPVETLQAFAYAWDSDEDGGRECSVCIDVVREGEMVRRLPDCMHVYHVQCIDRWLAEHSTCPLCRSKLDPCKCKARSDFPLPLVQGDPPDQLPP